MTTPNLAARIVRHEGLRLKAYKDSEGIWTIGAGHNIEADPELEPHLADLQENGITEAEAMTLLSQDLANVATQLDRYIPWWRKLDPVRQDVFAEMGFNIGVPAFSLWHHTLIAAESSQFKAAGQMLMHTQPWAGQVGPTRAGELGTMLASGVAI